jgi:tetratricopeptide (TPR) repeat protein
MVERGTTKTALKRTMITDMLLEEKDPEKLFGLGLTCLSQKLLHEAKRVFQQAHKLKPKEPRYGSYYGLSIALADRAYKEALQLCEAAALENFLYPDLFHNLGRVYLMAGRKGKAHQAFCKGLNMDPKNPDIIRELRKMGVRQKPPVSFLGRSNPVNKLMGKLRAKKKT